MTAYTQSGNCGDPTCTHSDHGLRGQFARGGIVRPEDDPNPKFAPGGMVHGHRFEVIRQDDSTYQAQCECGWRGDLLTGTSVPGELSREGAARQATRQGLAHGAEKLEQGYPPQVVTERDLYGYPLAEHVATLVAHSPGKVVSMTCTCGVSVVGDVMPFAAATRLMLEHLNGGKSDTVLRDLTQGAHSRACGIQWHPHGKDCTSDCPTCHGVGMWVPTVSPLGFPDR